MDAVAYKNQGNTAFSAGEYIKAIDSFSKAIDLDPTNHVLFSNRSASYAALHRYADALADAEKCVSLNREWAKGYVRKGAALHGLRRYDDAIEVYKQGLSIDPSMTALLDGVAAAEKDKQSDQRDPMAKVFGADTFQKIQQHPKLSILMLQPDYVQMIHNVIQDPSKASEYISDQRFMMTFMVLSGIELPMDSDDGADAPSASARPKAQPTSSTTKKAADAKEAPKEVQLSEDEKAAAALKEEGNTLYKQRRFDEALAKYTEASAKDPKNTVYLLNQTAVFFEKGEYEACITECDKALEHGRENKCDYTVIAKLMTRKALCLQRLKRHGEAIDLFKSALVEHRNPDTLAKLRACEKEKEKLDIEAYINPEIAAEKKAEGNNFFKEDKFPEAVACYTEAIKRNPTEHTSYSNRAAAYLKLGAYNEALQDSEKCLQLKPDFVKAHARRGHAFFWTKQFNKALQAYDDGLKIEPDNQECKEGRMRTMMKIQEVASGQSEDGDDVARRAMSDPEIAAIMQDSYMQLVLSEMQKDPSRVQDYMRDPGISAKINKLISAGIIRFGGSNDQQ